MKVFIGVALMFAAFFMSMRIGCAEPKVHTTHLEEIRYESGRVDTLLVDDWTGSHFDRKTGFHVWIDHCESIRRIQ